MVMAWRSARFWGTREGVADTEAAKAPTAAKVEKVFIMMMMQVSMCGGIGKCLQK